MPDDLHDGACPASQAHYEQALATCDFEFPWSDLLRAFKDHGRAACSQSFGLWLADTVRAADHEAPTRLVVAVPSSLEHLKRRGYNPAWQLAQVIAQHLGCRTHSQALRRLTQTADQRGLGRDQRRSAVRGVFQVPPAQRASLAGQSIALVDDVMTTGATLDEAARVLRHAGAASVHAWVVARAPRPSPAKAGLN